MLFNINSLQRYNFFLGMTKYFYTKNIFLAYFVVKKSDITYLPKNKVRKFAHLKYIIALYYFLDTQYLNSLPLLVLDVFLLLDSLTQRNVVYFAILDTHHHIALVF